MLVNISSVYPDQAVILRGDSKTYHENIIRLLNLCSQAKIWNISFATTPPETPPPSPAP